MQCCVDATELGVLTDARWERLTQLEGERVDARLGSGNTIAAIELERNELTAAASETAARLLDVTAGADTVLLGACAAAPGVPETLRRQGRRVLVLNARAACDGALHAERQILAAGPGLFLQRLLGQAA